MSGTKPDKPARQTRPKPGDSKVTDIKNLDPNKPAFHLVPTSVMQDLIDIVKELPYDQVYRVMPHLVSAEIIQPDAK